MKKLNIPAIVAIPLVYTVTPLFYAMFWWSKHIDGVEPKSGQAYREHKTVDGVTYVRQKGLRHRFDKWKLVPELPVGFCNLDVLSMYPSVQRTPEQMMAKIRLNSEYKAHVSDYIRLYKTDTDK